MNTFYTLSLLDFIDHLRHAKSIILLDLDSINEIDNNFSHWTFTYIDSGYWKLDFVDAFNSSFCYTYSACTQQELQNFFDMINRNRNLNYLCVDGEYTEHGYLVQTNSGQNL